MHCGALGVRGRIDSRYLPCVAGPALSVRRQTQDGMAFPRVTFAIFFLVVLPLSWFLMPTLHRTYRCFGMRIQGVPWKLAMLVASYVFLGYFSPTTRMLVVPLPTWSLILFVSTAVNWMLGQGLGRARDIDRAREPGSERTVLTRPRLWLSAAIVFNLGFLGYFKYYEFFVTQAHNAFSDMGLSFPIPVLSIALPVAISFFTFQAISYTADIYRGTFDPVNPLDFATYLAFFPHLVAGPVVRAAEFIPQMYERHDPRRVDATRAFALIAGGLFKKLVLADFLNNSIVTPVFTSPGTHSSAEILVGVYAYAVRIYCDFSGYTDMAIGIALLLGIKFPQNFDAPYTAISLQDFWRRWHMTLSRFLRDYLYIPLGGNRESAVVLGLRRIGSRLVPVRSRAPAGGGPDESPGPVRQRAPAVRPKPGQEADGDGTGRRPVISSYAIAVTVGMLFLSTLRMFDIADVWAWNLLLVPVVFVLVATGSGPREQRKWTDQPAVVGLLAAQALLCASALLGGPSVWWLDFLLIGSLLLVLAACDLTIVGVVILANLLATMALGGIWHGRGWTFLIWGVIHGLGLLAEHWHRERRTLRGLPAPKDTALRRTGGRLLTFNVVCFAWIFFNADSLSTASRIVKRLFTDWHWSGGYTPFVDDPLITGGVLLAIAIGLGVQFIPRAFGARLLARASRLHPMTQGVLIGLFFIVIDTLGPRGIPDFIYQQF
jgi:D-alanyl-lipoteichoic acid acyltransferase DltB (MBOAT superfamily)